jgi:hypothetical protein
MTSVATLGGDLSCFREVYTYRRSKCLDDRVVATSSSFLGFRMELTVSFLRRGGNLSSRKMRLNIDYIKFTPEDGTFLRNWLSVVSGSGEYWESFVGRARIPA